MEKKEEKVCKLMEKMEDAICAQFDKGIEQIDVDEMYKAVDIYKDLAEVKKNCYEAKYYESITDAMEEHEYGEDYNEYGRMYYSRPVRAKSSGRYMSRTDGRRGYADGRMMPPYEDDLNVNGGRPYNRYYYNDSASENPMSTGMTRSSDVMGGANRTRDYREGRSGMSRRNYMETTEMHKDNTEMDKKAKMDKLDTYMNDLSTDIKELVHNMTPEEKQMVKAKMMNLANVM